MLAAVAKEFTPTAGAVHMTKEFPGMGSRLQKLREAMKFSQQTLANLAGLSVATLSQLEEERKGNPKLKTLVALAKPLGLTPGQLVDELVQAEPSPKKGGRKG